MNSTFNLRNFLTENKLTRVSKLIKEEKTTTYTISDDMANSFGMNMEEFEETLQQRYGFKNYEEDVDYEWHFGRGDDFPNAVTILNKDMESDRRIQRFLEEIEGTVNLEERLGDEEENQNKKLRKEGFRDGRLEPGRDYEPEVDRGETNTNFSDDYEDDDMTEGLDLYATDDEGEPILDIEKIVNAIKSSPRFEELKEYPNWMALLDDYLNELDRGFSPGDGYENVSDDDLINDVLEYMKYSGDEDDEEENQNKKLRKEEVNYNSDAWVQAQRDEMGLDDEEIEENSFRVLDLPDGDYFAIDMNWDDEYKGKKGLFFTINGNDISGKDGSMETSPREFLSQFKPQEILKVEDSLEELENPLNEAPGFRQKINFDDIRPGSKLSNKFRSGKTYIVLSSDNKSATVKNVATGYVMTLYSLANYSLD